MKYLAFAVLLLGAAGCATTGAGYVPLVDFKPGQESTFPRDLSECQSFADVRVKADEVAAVGGAVAALVGAVLAPRGMRNESAGIAALFGAAGAATGAVQSQADIVKRCLSNRGYAVLH